MNLFAWPPVAEQRRDDELPETAQHRHHLCRLGALGERGEVADVEEQDGDLDLLADEIGALAQHALGKPGVDVGAERFAELLAFVESNDHRVERLRQASGLVCRDDRDARRVVAGAHLLGRVLKLVQRAPKRAGDEHDELERDRERDEHGDEHRQAEVGQARVVALGRESGDDDAGDDGDDRRGREQTPAQRQARSLDLEVGGQPLGDLLKHPYRPPHPASQLDRDEVVDRDQHL